MLESVVNCTMTTETTFVRKGEFMNRFAAGEGVDTLYNEWAQKYDEDNDHFVMSGHFRIFDAVEKYCTSKDAVILDAGAGTGRTALEIKKRGYTTVDAVDASEAMLKKAEKTKAYRNMYCQFIGPTPIPVPDNSYDCVVGMGVIAPNHLPAESYLELFRVLKPGGHLIIQGNHNVWCRLSEFHVTVANTLQGLVDNKGWTLVEWTVIEDYYEASSKFCDKGLLFVYRKL